MPQIEQDWLSHQALMIVKGIPKTPNDQLSAEVGTTVFDLMSGTVSLDSDNEWSPKIAVVKNGGVWAESPINDGRRLLAAPVANVTEQITIIITGSGYLDIMHQLIALNQMVKSCRDYWQSIAQTEPVYLMWWANCAPGPQYALLSDIELAPTYLASPLPTLRVSMTLEREPYWRMGVPPGANPKIWTYYINASHPQFNSNVATLVTLSDHLITQTIQNKFEWTPAAYGLQTSTISQNYIDITAAQVPGDAPALVEMSITGDTVLANIFIGLSSKKLSGTGHDGVLRRQSYVLNVGDYSSGVSTKTSAGSSAGVKSNNSSTLFYDGIRTVTGIDANYVNFARWGESIANGIKLDRDIMRGTYAIFARAINTSGTPVLTDMTMRILIEETENAGNQYLNVFTGSDVYVPTATASGNYQLTYMGVITLPFETRSVQSPLGYGVQFQEANNNLRITLQQKVLVATANRTMEAVDVIFMPIDEAMSQIVLPVPSTILSTTPIVLIDNTGYLNHGQPEQTATCYITNANSGGVSAEVRGNDLNLVPGIDQHLHFILNSYMSAAANDFASYVNATMTIRLNIVPRCSGIRDV